MTHETWGRLREQLVKIVGPNNYRSWIEPLEFSDVNGGVATFLVPTDFTGTWVSRNFGDQILKVLVEAGEQVKRVRFFAPKGGQANTSVNTGSEVNAITDRQTTTNRVPTRTHTDSPGAPLDARFTFDTFVVGKPNELAHAAARRVADGGMVTFNPLFLYGGVGLGKTHLMHAVAWELLRRSPELKVVYLSAEQFMYRFIQALRDKDMITFKQLFRSVDVLMIDDIQFIGGKDATQEEFFHTFNWLIDHGKQVIVSSDSPPTDISGMEERIVSRLQSGLVVDLHPTNYELRLGILQQKIELYADQFPNLEIDDGVLEFLAHRISTNVRVLEGAMMRLFAFGSLVDRSITLEMAQECLSDALRASDRKITVEEIQRKVSDHYNIRLSDLIGPKRVRTFARPRQVAMYLAKQLTSRSLPEIARRFGGRDHTTIMHGVRKIEELKKKDSQIADDLELLRRSLEA